MSAGLTVLFANLAMFRRDGSTMYTRDVALELARSGHRPVLYTPRPGIVSEELAAAGVPVVSHPGDAPERPDVIHGNHTVETAVAVAELPGVPAVFVCHGVGWMTEPPKLAAVRRYVAVGSVSLRRLVEERAVPAERCSVLFNGVDTDRFRPPSDPRPARPRRALVFTDSPHPGAFTGAIGEACEARGIELDVAGPAFGRTLDRPEEVLPAYDLVFARGRYAARGGGLRVRGRARRR